MTRRRWQRMALRSSGYVFYGFHYIPSVAHRRKEPTSEIITIPMLFFKARAIKSEMSLLEKTLRGLFDRHVVNPEGADHRSIR